VEVKLGERSYDIHVAADALARAGALLKPFARGVVPVVTDKIVAALHLETLASSLAAQGIRVIPVILEPGEKTKSFRDLEQLCAALLTSAVERNDLIIALGGGVIGDLTGFAAGILKRGINFAQVPTTLLAQVDSSVGGKTAINTAHGKNLVGLFHQPRIVIADTGILKTLPPRELRAGYAEVVKYGALGDADFFAWLEMNGGAALQGDSGKVEHLVAHSCRMKADIVARDERETGDRALLNLGHTFGHALEAETGYRRLLHGEAVAWGMIAATNIALSVGRTDSVTAGRIADAVLSLGRLPEVNVGARKILARLQSDKKTQNGVVHFILPREIGKVEVASDVPESAVLDSVEELRRLSRGGWVWG